MNKIFLIILVILILYFIYNCFNSNEGFAVDPKSLSDVDAIKNLAAVAKDLQTVNGITLPGSLTIKDNELKLNGLGGPGQLRMIYDKYAAIIRNDGGALYLPLLTNKDNINGSWNDLRPLYIDLASGKIFSNNGQEFSGNTTINGNTYTKFYGTSFAKNKAGVDEPYLWPRAENDQMFLNYGRNGFFIRNVESKTTMKMEHDGSIDIGDGKFKIDANGNVTIKGNLNVEGNGNVKIKGNLNVEGKTLKVGDWRFNNTSEHGHLAINNFKTHNGSAGFLWGPDGGFYPGVNRIPNWGSWQPNFVDN